MKSEVISHAELLHILETFLPSGLSHPHRTPLLNVLFSIGVRLLLFQKWAQKYPTSFLAGYDISLYYASIQLYSKNL